MTLHGDHKAVIDEARRRHEEQVERVARLEAENRVVLEENARLHEEVIALLGELEHARAIIRDALINVKSLKRFLKEREAAVEEEIDELRK